VEKLAIILILLFATPVFASESPKSYGMRWDRLMHIYAGTIISTNVTMWSQKYWDVRASDSWMYGIGSALVIGYAKESMDWKTLNPMRWHKDSYYDLGGFALGAITGYFLTCTF